ncbi:MAG: hypothetical protein LBC92_00165, partial [Rickettsiales bacterium]|nr:hypothetical protein [Rickettsiales bacterium]
EEINRKKREEIIREATRKLHPTSVINHRDLRLPPPSPMSRNLITRETISKTSTSIQLPCLLYLSQKELSGGSKLPPLKDGEQPITPPTQKLRRNNINPSSQLQRQPAPTWVNE